MTFHERLTALETQRASSGPLPPGVAPPISSKAFRSQLDQDIPATRCWDKLFSLESRNRHASSLKATAHVAKASSIINLGTARPASLYSPWESMTVTAQDLRFPTPATVDLPTTVISCARGEANYDLGLAMNYGFSAGSPQLLRFITEHVELVHNPPYQEWATCLTCGSTSAIDILFRMLCNRGDWILAECKVYSGAIEAAKPLGINILGVQMDSFGLMPSDLDAKLRSWDSTVGPKPFVLYTVPTGQNPTGITQSLERREAIYKVAEEHDLCIIEDDPYYFLQLAGEEATVGGMPMSASEYLRQLPPSLLSLDRAGRVLRLDATSKNIAPGLRCGWLTGPTQMISKFLDHTEFSTVSPSGPSQLMLYKLLDETWGHEGFFNWLIHLSQRLRRCRDTMAAACTRYLPAEICQWQVPAFGMFFWIQIDSFKHPALRCSDLPADRAEACRDIEHRLHTKAKANGVQVSKGSWFAVDKELWQEISFRLTFAASEEDTLDQAVQRFGDALKEEFGLYD